jgi:hypothetical protein
MRGVLEALNLPATDDCTVTIGGFGIGAEVSRVPPPGDDAPGGRPGGPLRR